jgi:type II secretory pathway pseudopilin PulG
MTMHDRRTMSRGNRSAFTLVELLVVVGIIIALAGLLLPVLGGAREQGRRAQCLSNLRQLTAAWIAYAHDNDSHLCSADLGLTWSWCGPTTNHNDIVGDLMFPQLQLEKGVLWGYLKDAKVYRCPDDPSPVEARRCSYQININMSGTVTTDPLGEKVNSKDPLRSNINFIRLDDIPNTASAFVWIEGANPAVTLRKCFNSPSPPENTFRRDGWPGNNHRGNSPGTGISFADGHAIFWQYADSRTVNLVESLAAGLDGPVVPRPGRPSLYPDHALTHSPDVMQLEEWVAGTPTGRLNPSGGTGTHQGPG